VCDSEKERECATVRRECVVCVMQWQFMRVGSACVLEMDIREPSVSVCCRCYRSDVSEDAIHGETITPTASSSPS
jgi:hypothetical protein